MDVLNMAVMALFDSLTSNNFDKELLLEGTHLKLNFMLDVKKKHSWIDFIKMYENAAKILGPEKVAKEIAYHGLYNNKISTLRKIGTGLFDVKLGYWFLATVGCRHLFKDAVKFKYQKINSNQLRLEIQISSELEDCPLLLETYTYFWENAPTTLGLPKARVEAIISERKGVYIVNFDRTSYFRLLFYKLTRPYSGYTSSIELMEELETLSLQTLRVVEEKSELLRIMSHDISNRVAAIDMSLKIVLKKEIISEDDRRNIKVAMENTDRLCKMLKNVQKLEIAHIRGVITEQVDLDQTFSAVSECFKELLSIKNITLTFQNNLPPHVKVYAEKSSLEMNVLSNLVSNAIKFSNAGSLIAMRAYIEDGQIIISVADQGKGIPPEERKSLFVRKIRTSTVGTAGEVGAGFGLGIVNTYVQFYGGTILVTANYPTGTIFKISLPIQTQDELTPIRSYTEATHAQTHQRLH